MQRTRVKLSGKLSFAAVSFITALFICCLATGLVFAEEELAISKAEASSQYSSYYSPSKAIDNNLTTTFWRGGTSQSTWWLNLDLSKGYSLTKISIWWHSQSGSRDYNIEGSNDSIDWTTLYSRLSSVGGATNPYKVTYSLSGSYRYVRVYINKPQVFGYQPVIFEVKLYGQTQVLSISINPKLWDIGSTEVNKVITMNQTNKIAITNDGTIPETLELSLVNPEGWDTSTSPGQETYVLSGLFCNTTDIPTESRFNQDAQDDDVITKIPKQSTNTIFGYSQSTANGVAIPIGASRSLYLQFKSPTITKEKGEEEISVIITCKKS